MQIGAMWQLTPPTTMTVSYSWQTYKLQPHSNKHDLSGTKSK